MKKNRTARKAREFEYDVCLSFAGEDRRYVRRVADALREQGIRVFFDEYVQADMWGKDLYTHLDDVYQNAARYCVLFASRNYARRVWTNHERESAQARAFRQHNEYLLPARFDNTPIPGLRATVGYVDLSKLSPKDLVVLIAAKIGEPQRENFFPPVPDRLFKHARARAANARDRVEARARNFFNALQRMQPDERTVVFRVFLHTCVAELPDNVHASLDLLSRITGFSEGKILRLASGLRSLGFFARVRDRDEHDEHLGEMRTLVLEWQDFSVDKDVGGNATATARDVVIVASDSYCEDHGFIELQKLNFSQLATATRREHVHTEKSPNEALQRTSRARRTAKPKGQARAVRS